MTCTIRWTCDPFDVFEDLFGRFVCPLRQDAWLAANAKRAARPAPLGAPRGLAERSKDGEVD